MIRRSLAVFSLSAALTLAAATPVHAGADPEVTSHAVGLNRFAPLLVPSDLTIVPAGGVLGHLRLGVGLFFNYQRGSLKLFAADAAGEITGVLAPIVKNQLAANFLLGLGITDYLQLSLDLPFTFFQDGLGINEMGEPSGGIAARGLGDLKIGVRGRPWEGEITEGLILRVGAGVDVSFPTGDERNFLGEQGVVIGGHVAAGLIWNKKLEAALMIGYRARTKPTILFNIGFGDEFVYGAAVGFKPIERLRASAALTGYLGGPLRENNPGAGPDAMGGDLDQSPMELDGFVDFWLFDDLMFTAGAGAGLRGGVGAPDFRAVLGARWTPSIPDTIEKIVKKKGDDEDDLTGKSYVDDDGDGVPNRDDLCPKEAEDADKFDDEDGCPEADNDRDGIPDGLDTCPNAPEDKDGITDTDGCPDVDDDGDGVFNDGDRCAGPLEDIDGCADEDGCPDPDNDGDGLLDADDKCPDEAEVLNGVSDFDGCADEGESRFFIDPDSRKIAALDTLRWVGKTVDLDPSGTFLLEELVAQLRFNRWVSKVKITLGTKGLTAALATSRLAKVKSELTRLGLEPGRFVLADVKKGDEGTMLFDVTDSTTPGPLSAKCEPVGAAPAPVPVPAPAPAP